jgi:hypothetical protein
MGAPDIMAAVARKYDILQQTANSEGALRSAQASGITGAQPSENALRMAQAGEAGARAQTIGPTAAAANAATYAGIPAQQAQAPYLTAQTRTLNDMLAPGGDTLGNWFADQHLRQGGSFAPDITAKGVAYAEGTSNVPAPGQTITGGSWEGPQSQGGPPAPLPPTPATGGDLRRRLGLGVVRAAAGDPNIQPARNVPQGAPPVAYPTPTPDTGAPSFGTRRSLAAYAEGTANVPGPGQTITGGSWEGPQSNGPAPAPLPPPATTGTDLRRRLGLGVVRAAAGDPNIQPARNVPQGAPPVAYPVPTPDTGGQSFGTRRSLAAYADGTDNVQSAPTGPSSSPVATVDAANTGAGTTIQGAAAGGGSPGFSGSPTGPSSSPVATGDAPGANVGATTQPGGFTTYDAPPGSDSIGWSQHAYSGQMNGHDVYGVDAQHPHGQITAIGGGDGADNPNSPQAQAASAAWANSAMTDPSVKWSGGKPGAGVGIDDLGAGGAWNGNTFSHGGQNWVGHYNPKTGQYESNEYAKGTSKVPGRGMPAKGKGKAPPPHSAAPPSMPMPPGPMGPPPGPMGPPPGPMGPPPGPMGAPAAPGGPAPGPGALPGLAQALNAAMGAPSVPGQRPPPGTPQDTVPAVLTPGEAVLTPGSAQQLGRNKIAAMNAHNPPAGPAGAPVPGRGMPRPPTQHIHVHIHNHGK